MNPTTIATAVVAIAHFGSSSTITFPSTVAVLHLSAQPDNAINVTAGPRPPHIKGVILDQYLVHDICAFSVEEETVKNEGACDNGRVVGERF